MRAYFDLVPDLAASMSVSKDWMTLTVKIALDERLGSAWRNGGERTIALVERANPFRVVP